MEKRLDNQKRGRRVSLVEGRARPSASTAEAEKAEFTLTLYADQISLHISDSPGTWEFIVVRPRVWVLQFIAPRQMHLFLGRWN